MTWKELKDWAEKSSLSDDAIIEVGVFVEGQQVVSTEIKPRIEVHTFSVRQVLLTLHEK